MNEWQMMLHQNLRSTNEESYLLFKLPRGQSWEAYLAVSRAISLPTIIIMTTKLL